MCGGWERGGAVEGCFLLKSSAQADYAKSFTSSVFNDKEQEQQTLATYLLYTSQLFKAVYPAEILVFLKYSNRGLVYLDTFIKQRSNEI